MIKTLINELKKEIPSIAKCDFKVRENYIFFNYKDIEVPCDKHNAFQTFLDNTVSNSIIYNTNVSIIYAYNTQLNIFNTYVRIGTNTNTNFSYYRRKCIIDQVKDVLNRFNSFIDNGYFASTLNNFNIIFAHNGYIYSKFVPKDDVMFMKNPSYWKCEFSTYEIPKGCFVATGDFDEYGGINLDGASLDFYENKSKRVSPYRIEAIFTSSTEIKLI